MFLPSRMMRHVQTAVKNPRYFISRIRAMGYQLLHPSEPWLTKDALRALKSFVAGDMRAFEWGSGKSTLWLAQHVSEVVSIEHDPLWYSRVQAMLSDARIRNARLRLADPARYAGEISAFPDDYFDFVLIDGADRNGCIRAAAAKVRPGGWIVVDNADSGWDYSPLAEYRRIVTCNGIWQTDIFVRSTQRASHGPLHR
jgi:predicted O-methyltransferase YrrM